MNLFFVKMGNPLYIYTPRHIYIRSLHTGALGILLWKKSEKQWRNLAAYTWQ